MMLVIADDITGAAEIAGVCLRYGLSVSFGIDELPAHNSDICIIATDSRSLTENKACEIHKKIAETAFQLPDFYIFKKCDSALRGYILSELSALTEAGGLDTVVLQPANPLSGRFIRNGEYYIGSEKIENSGFLHDPDFPTYNSSVRKILLSRSDIKHKFDIHTGDINKINSKGVYVPDCSSVDDLVRSTKLAGEKTLLCGSAAFFEQVLIKKFNCTPLNLNQHFAFPDEFLLISGSTHPGSRSFVESLKENNFTVRTIPEKICSPEVNIKDIENWVYELTDAWNRSKKLLITTSPTSPGFPDSPKILSKRIGTIVQKFLQQVTVTEIFVTGGATSYALLKTMDWKALIPVNELSAGVVRMKISGSDTFMTMKPGSYSWPVTSVQ